MMTRLLRWIAWGWYAMVFFLPLQTVYILQEGRLGDLEGVWQYGTRALYATDVLLVGLVLVSALLWWRGYRVRVDVRGVCIALVVSALVQSGIATMQVVWGVSPASVVLGMSAHSAATLGDSVVEVEGVRWLRGYGTMPHPNILGLFLTSGLVAGMWYALQVSDRRARILMNVVLACIVCGLVATFSRGAWIAGCVGVILVMSMMVMMTARAMRRDMVVRGMQYVVVMTIMLVVCAMVWWVPMSARLGVSDMQRLEVRSYEERVVSWQEGVALWRAHPWLGVGFGESTRALYMQDIAAGEVRPVYAYQPPHNFFLVVVVELGVVGLLLIGLLKMYVVRSTYARVMRGDEYARYVAVLFLGVWATYMVSGLFDHFLWTLHAGWVLWLIPLLMLL